MESFFKLQERGTDVGTEIRAGVTTFLVMVYIVALNPAIIAGPLELDPVAVAAGTALVAGIMTLAMGLLTNYPFALAAGLGLNAVVAFSLPALGMTPAQAMGVIVIEGLFITVLVLVGLREAIMNAVPLGLKRAIGVGIGLFILFIGFWEGGMIVGVTPEFAPPPPPLSFVFPNSAGQCGTGSTVSGPPTSSGLKSPNSMPYVSFRPGMQNGRSGHSGGPPSVS